MKIGPDGSLPRITSSLKDTLKNIRIIKVPDSIPSYKLVIVKPIVYESSDSSEAELSDDGLFDDIKFPSESIEKEKVVRTKTNNLNKQNEADSEGVMKERNHYNRHRQYHKKNNRYYGQRNSSYNKISKHYKSLSNTRGIYNYGNRDMNPSASRDFNLSSSRNFNSPASGQDFNSPASGRDMNSSAGCRDMNSSAGCRDMNSAAGCRDINSATGCRNINSAASGRDINSAAATGRDFNSTVDHHVPYNTDNYQHTAQHSSDPFPISPWLDFQPALPQYSQTPFPQIPPPQVPFPGNPRHSLGLLGDRPSYAPSLPMFQPNKPNNFVCDQTALYPSMTSSFSSNTHNNSFVHNQNSSYSEKMSNYPSSKKTDNFISDKNYRNDNYGNYRKNNQQRNKHMNYNNERKQNAWNKGPRRHPNERNNASRNNKPFDYRK